jgi:MoaA/NifB/PqqE/SkfB family radical SAM enzyme
VRHNRLLTLDLETSRACNLRCIYCYANSGRKRENELSLTELRGVVDQAIRLGARVVTVIGGGEPLLYPRIRNYWITSAAGRSSRICSPTAR